MVSLPLSCLADLLRHPGAALQCRAWRSARSGRSGVQIALSFWQMAPLDQRPAAEAIAENTTVGLESVGAATHRALSSTHSNVHTVVELPELNYNAIDFRDTIRDPPSDIDHIVSSQRLNFKVFAMLAILGFEGHSELDAHERATLAAVEQFIALCKDELWENIEESLVEQGVSPIAADRDVLKKMRADAQERSTNLLATRRAYDHIHAKRTEESEKTFYQSLIKKTEERTVSASKPLSLSITEAKIRKARC